MPEPARVGVCGFGRCGSSMVMRMLAAGGIPSASGAAPGSGEHPRLVDAIKAATPGTAVKLLDLKLAVEQGEAPPLGGAWNLIWLDRDPRWQAESFRKFIRWAAGVRLSVRETRVFREHLIRDRDPSVGWLRGLGHPLMTLRYEDILTAPADSAAKLATFLPWTELDHSAMAAVVHNRKPQTRPDMACEEGHTERLDTDRSDSRAVLP